MAKSNKTKPVSNHPVPGGNWPSKNHKRKSGDGRGNAVPQNNNK